jgi:hypothetical protein
MERPDISALLKHIRERGSPLEFDDVTYYVGHATIVRREDGKGLAKWEEALFAAMERNAMHVSDFFQASERQPRRNRPGGRDLIARGYEELPPEKAREYIDESSASLGGRERSTR